MNTEEKIDVIVQKLRNYFEVEKCAIIGVSGGVDSAVVLALCTKAIGPKRIHSVIMPHGNQNTFDSVSVCTIFDTKNNFIINIKIIVDEFSNNPPFTYNDIKIIVDEFSNNPPFTYNDIYDPSKLVRGNICARVRMTILYSFANKYNGLVIGTSNKSEIALGYFTKYGDGGVDIEPIGDIYKTEIFSMARILNVPKKIIDKPPSAELWDGQTDEDDIGAHYSIIDKMLEVFLKPNYTEKEIERLTYTYGVDKVERIIKMMRSAQHKRMMPPVFKIE